MGVDKIDKISSGVTDSLPRIDPMHSRCASVSTFSMFLGTPNWGTCSATCSLGPKKAECSCLDSNPVILRRIPGPRRWDKLSFPVRLVSYSHDWLINGNNFAKLPFPFLVSNGDTSDTRKEIYEDNLYY